MSVRPRHRVVSLDGDETLWQWNNALQAGLDAAAKRLAAMTGPQVPQTSTERLTEIRQSVAAEWAGRGRTLVAIRRESLRRAAIELSLEGSSAEADELLGVFSKARDAALVLFDDTLDALTALRGRGYTVGLLTNGNADPSVCGVASYLDFVLQAENIGASKPDVRAFEAVREATGCPLSDVVHVGDSLDTDVLGALRAGATAIWLNRNGSLEDNGVLAHHQVRTLTELPALIDTL